MSLELALKRKEALKALRQQIERDENNKNDNNDDDDKNDDIDESRQESGSSDENVVQEIQVQESQEEEEADDDNEDLEISNLRSKKPDWDLKRNIEDKLKRLEKRTQRAIFELIRERVMENKKAIRED